MSATTANADVDLFGGKVKAGGYFAQQWQSSIEVDGPAGALNNAGDANADSGFNRLRFGMWFNIQIAEGVSAFVELAEEPNDFSGGTPFAISQDLAWVDLQLGNDVVFRVGNVVETTMNFIRYSDGAAVQGNPMIGNGVNDRITAAEGIWLLGNHKTSMGDFSWNATVTKPSFFSDFSDESGYNYGLRSALTTTSGFGIGAGLMIYDGDATCTSATACSLANGGGIRSLMGVGDGDNYEFSTTGLTARRSVPGILPGIDGHTWQIDAMWSGDNLGVPVTIHGFYGQSEDEYSFAPSAGQTVGSFASGAGFSQTDAEEEFWGILGRVDLTEDFYLATRYGVLSNETAGANGSETSRIQFGGGYWLNDSTLLKVEYVSQEEDTGAGGGLCIQSADCEWDGFVIEGSVSF